MNEYEMVSQGRFARHPPSEVILNLGIQDTKPLRIQSTSQVRDTRVKLMRRLQ